MDLSYLITDTITVKYDTVPGVTMLCSAFCGEESILDLERLTICNHSIRSISPIKSLSKLKYVNLSGNRIMDLSPLTSLYLLQELHLDSNNICCFPHVQFGWIVNRRICTS